MSHNLISRCQGRWRSILPEVGIPVSALTGKHGPCPICGGKDRFRFDDRKPAGSGSWLCNLCGSGYGIHLVMKVNGWSFKKAADVIDEILGTASPETSGESRDARSALASANSIWKASLSIAIDDAVGRYLATRGLTELAAVKWLRRADGILYLEDGEFQGRFPTMLAVLTAADGKVTGIHRTYLTSAGRMADVASPRKILGTLPEGAAVRLMEHSAMLGIAEGIETAMSAAALFRVPCWSAINSHGLGVWSPPAEVREVVVFSDNDAKFGGQAAAYKLAHRLACQGLKVRVEIPTTVGQDWNDVLLNSRRTA